MSRYYGVTSPRSQTTDGARFATRFGIDSDVQYGNTWMFTEV
jgi:hypothetical protein